MPASVEILNVPIGSVLTSFIGANDEADKNDFTVLAHLWGRECCKFDCNPASCSRECCIAVLLSFEGANSVCTSVQVRPPQTETGTVTVTVAANAVAEGNAETSKDIEVVTDYPDTDAETPTLLFNHSNLTNASGLTVSPTRIIAIRGGDTTASVVFFTHAGVQQTTETLTPSIVGTAERIEYFNDTLLIAGNQIYRGAGAFQFNGFERNRKIRDPLAPADFITHTRLGVIGITTTAYYTHILCPTLRHHCDTMIGSNTNCRQNLVVIETLRTRTIYFTWRKEVFQPTFLPLRKSMMPTAQPTSVNSI